MYELYTAATPNGKKVSILLEELGLEYDTFRVDLRSGEQHSSEFRTKNPNGKIPVLVDNKEQFSIFESGAIMVYLAEKHARFLPMSGRARYSVLQWLMFQMSGVGPMFGQLGYFKKRATESVPYAIAKYEKEVVRLLDVMNGVLLSNNFIADQYSVADMALFPWLTATTAYLEVSLDPYPAVREWSSRIGEREAVQKGMAI